MCSQPLRGHPSQLQLASLWLALLVRGSLTGSLRGGGESNEAAQGGAVNKCEDGWAQPPGCVEHFSFAGDGLSGCTLSYATDGRPWCGLDNTSDGMNYATCLPCAACAKDYNGCAESKCCATEGFRCYEKDEGWAGCFPDCEPGVHEGDPVPTPWSCKVLGDTVAAWLPLETTTQTTTTATWTTATRTASCKGKCCVGDKVTAEWPHNDGSKGKYFRAAVAVIADSGYMTVRWHDGNPPDDVPAWKVKIGSEVCAAEESGAVPKSSGSHPMEEEEEEEEAAASTTAAGSSSGAQAQPPPAEPEGAMASAEASVAISDAEEEEEHATLQPRRGVDVTNQSVVSFVAAKTNSQAGGNFRVARIVLGVNGAVAGVAGLLLILYAWNKRNSEEKQGAAHLSAGEKPMLAPEE